MEQRSKGWNKQCTCKDRRKNYGTETRLKNIEKSDNEKKEREIDMREMNEKAQRTPDEHKAVATGFKEDSVEAEVKGLLEKSIYVSGMQ